MYTGVTNNLERRIFEHKNKTIKGFSSQYELNKLVYYEVYGDIEMAISREKQIKRWSRAKKNDRVNDMNPEWKDLSEGWYEDPSAALGMTKGRVV